MFPEQQDEAVERALAALESLAESFASMANAFGVISFLMHQEAQQDGMQPPPDRTLDDAPAPEIPQASDVGG